jgi:hypothetical protein
MKRIIAILLAVASIVGTKCSKWSDDKDSFSYRFVTEKGKRVTDCVYLQPGTGDTLLLGTDKRFHKINRK